MCNFATGNKKCKCFLNTFQTNELRLKTSNKLHENE